MQIEPERRVENTEAFLRMAAIELRRMAEEAPEIATGLRHLAEQLEAEADELGGRDRPNRASVQ